MSQATQTVGIFLPVRNEADLKKYLKWAIGFELPDVQCCANHTSAWRAFCNIFFGQDVISLILASRGLGGKSEFLAALIWAWGTLVKADATILGGSGKQSQDDLRYLQAFWENPNAPKVKIGDRAFPLLVGDPTKCIQQLRWGNKIEALMASQTSVRGPHPQKQALDEVDEMSYEIFKAALGQAMSRNGICPQIVCASTRQYMDGTMSSAIKMAMERGWPFYEWCYRESLGTNDFDWVHDGKQWHIKLRDGGRPPCGWLSVSDVEAKRNTVPDEMWLTEYENQEPNPESRAINTDAINKMFKKELGIFKGSKDEVIEIEQPNLEARYATGTDWAKDQDWTIIITWRTDINPWRLVAFQRRGREEYPAMIAAFNRQCGKYKGNVAHDKTGVGNAIHDFIGVQARGVILTGMDRANILMDYVAAIESGTFEAPYIEWMVNEHKYASHADLYKTDSQKHHLPDTICAAALGYYAVTHGGIKIWV